MYEENGPLTDGDAEDVFADELAKLRRDSSCERSAPISGSSVLRWASRTNQPHLMSICRRLLLPGSGIVGGENLNQLSRLARAGGSCLLCLNHRSNLDAPTLQTLLEDSLDSTLFHQIIWLAGRRLEEDAGLTGTLVQCVNRVIVTPPSWFIPSLTEEQVREGRQVNIAAKRAVSQLRHKEWIFALFPSATRERPGDEKSAQAIQQTDSYLRGFQYLLLCHIDGCTLPVSKDRDFTHETPRLDRVTYTFGPVQMTQDWRAGANSRFPQLDQRMASAAAIKEDIEALAREA